MYGAHRHVFAAEPNLNADDDNFFNDNVGSLAVLAGDWSFYSDANFHGLYGSYGTPVVPGNYPDLTQLSITLVGAGRESGDDYQVVMEGSLAEV